MVSFKKARAEAKEAAPATVKEVVAEQEATEVAEPVETEVVEEVEVQPKAPTKVKKEVVKAEPKAEPKAVESSLAKREASAPIAVNMADAGFMGSWGRDDLQMPRLNLVQGSGDLGKEFKYGSFVFNKTVQINDGGSDAFPIIFLQSRKYYQENVDFDDDVMGKTFESLDEARAEGFTEGYAEAGTVSPICELEVLVPVPEGVEGDYEFEDTQFVRALYSVKGTAYSSVAKKLFSACMLGHLKGKKLHEGIWELSAFEKSKGKLTWMVPSLKSAGLIADNPDLGEKFLSFLKNEVL